MKIIMVPGFQVLICTYSVFFEEKIEHSTRGTTGELSAPTHMHTHSQMNVALKLTT